MSPSQARLKAFAEEDTRIWEALSDKQRTAIKDALSAYLNHEGLSPRVSMWRAILAYQEAMK